MSGRHNGQGVRLQLDSVSDWTIISALNHKRIGALALKYVVQKVYSASGNLIKVAGKFNCKTTFNGCTHFGTCYVAERENLNVFGNDWMEDLGLNDVPINSTCSKIESRNESNSKSKFETGLQQLRINVTKVQQTKRFNSY